ncbi:EAL domain-containing protein [Rhodoferax sp. PAMC 29310]|uniref:sensor domain-containing protein n=1 Tax=Rhodoferax sp. PAMC 29310 TaxID=2822760 RepID=UPI00351CE347
MHDANGDIIGVVLVFSDVTEAYRVNEALAETTKLLERTGELAKVGGWELDLRTQKLKLSNQTIRLNQAELGASPTLEDGLNAYSEDIRPVLTQAIQTAISTGEPFNLELPRVSQGRTIWLRTQGRAVFEDGEAIKIEGASQEITERKLAELALKDSETRFRNLVEWMPEAIVVHRDGIILYVNPAAATLFGATSAQQLVGTAALDRVHPEDRDRVIQRIQSLTQLGGSAPLADTRFLQLDGTVIDIQIQGTQIMYDGAPAVQAVMRDVSARRQSERLAAATQQALNKSAQHTQTILNNLMDGVITISSQGQIESINKAACALFGYMPEEVLGRNVSMLTPEPHRSQHDGYLKRYLSTGQTHIMGKLTEIEGVRKDGTLFPMSLQLSEIVTPEYTTFIGIARDITQHRQDIEEIRRLAFYDSLTGLPDRRLLMDRLRQAMHTSNRSGHHGALMFLDLDHFKQLNDTQGHDIGDLLLQQVACRIQGCARVGNSLARLGGDEFVVLLENLSGNGTEAANQAEIVANKVLHSFQSAFNLNGHDHESTSSIGIVVFRGELDAMDELLKKADLAMYQAKAAGRNNARFYDPAMQAAVAARDALEKDMRDALATQAFALHYQIQVNHTGATTGAEALVRWNHPSKGMVSPAHFIPLAEETGLIQPLGQWVLETACAQLVKWANAEDSAHWTVSVNVSALQFALPDYVQTVTSALQKTGANPRLLKLELTESMLASDVDDVVAKMRDLKSQGVSLSLDDFGTGYPSLAYLKLLPLDQIKIDQSFVRNVLTDASDAAIARTILALGRSLGLQVIAEGVETLEQRNFLAGIGCQAYQGYYFGRPVAADALHQVASKKDL